MWTVTHSKLEEQWILPCLLSCEIVWVKSDANCPIQWCPCIYTYIYKKNLIWKVLRLKCMTGIVKVTTACWCIHVHVFVFIMNFLSTIHNFKISKRRNCCSLIWWDVLFTNNMWCLFQQWREGCTLLFWHLELCGKL